MLRNRLNPLWLLIPVLLGSVACDNVGRAFDPSVDPTNPGTETGTSTIQVVPVGGDAKTGRPAVRATYPSGSGWPSTVPIVVEFSESINEATILPTTTAGLDGRIGVRLQGTTQFLPAEYDFLANGRLLILRPINGLPNQVAATYEVVLLPEGRDVDGVRFQVTGGERILSDFQVNQDASITDGSIVAIYPRDNNSEQTREGEFFVVFDSPANASTLLDTNLFVRPEGGAAISFDVEVPLATIGISDPRVVRLNPDAALQSLQRYEFVVTSAITFGQDGKLDFKGRTPFSRFTTVAPAVPTGVELANASVGFPNKINIDNALSVMLNVETPADSVAGDVVVARIYGGDAETTQTFDQAFLERTASVPAAGAQTVTIDFTGQLGNLQTPKLDDGDIVFAAKIERGGQSSGFIQHASTDAPIFDITRPTLLQAGPAGSGTDIYTESESLSYFGTASEGLAAVALEDGVNSTASMFGSSSSGRFLVLPVQLGRLTSERNYNIVLTDLAGNMSTTAAAGVIRQRGLVTGALAGTLTVEAYDYATLEPIVGATVLVDPSTPSPTGVGQLPPLTTGADGRVSFTSGLGSAHTITIVRAGYDLATIYGTQSAFVSLPLSPVSNATANLRGTAAQTPTPGATAIVGTTAFADHSVLGARTTNAAPTEIPATAILPNRAQVLTAFGGTFEPTAKPTFLSQACQLCGATLLAPTAPPAPALPGGVVSPTLALSPVVTALGQLAATDSVDFGLAVGLDLANLVGGSPRARVTSSLAGFAGQALVGIGAVNLVSGSTYAIDANWSQLIIAGLAGFSPISWIVTEAEDTDGRLSRTRAFLYDPVNGLLFPGVGTTAIPTITAPGAAFVGSPEVTVADVLNAAIVPGATGRAFLEVTATDSAGRRWHMLVPDRDGATGTDTLQFPDLQTSSVAGLAAGTWQMLAEARLAVFSSSVDDFVLSERYRSEANYSRSKPVTFTVN